jgi:hypothetical protein
MSVTLDGTGGVFTRIGALYRWMVEVRAQAGGTGVAGRWPYELNDLFVKVEDAPNLVQQALDGIPDGLVTAQSGVVSLGEALKAAAQTILIEQVNADDNLPEKTVAEALRVLIEQVTTATRWVQGNTVTATVTDSATDGDGTLICSVLDGRGRTLENVLAEDVICQRDETSQSFICRGEEAADSKLAVNWPQGSGANATVEVADAAVEDIVLNGHFNDFTVLNTPDDWSIMAGVAGTQILEETTNKLAGAKSLEFVGHATAAHIRQDITARVSAREPIAVNVFLKVDVVPAAGVLTIDLFDGTSVINDDAGTANTLAVTCSTLTTSWVAKNAFFRLPEPKPATVYLRVRLSTAVSVGSSLFIDQLAAVEATRLYDGGPYVAAFEGGTEFSADDVFMIAIANNRTGKHQEAFDVFFDTREDDVRIPTAGAGAIIANSYPTYEGS